MVCGLIWFEGSVSAGSGCWWARKGNVREVLDEGRRGECWSRRGGALQVRGRGEYKLRCVGVWSRACVASGK
jgi:hypothetical protein